MNWRELRDMDSGKLLGLVSPDGRYLSVKRGDMIDALVDLRSPVGPRCLSQSERKDLVLDTERKV